MDLQVLFPVLDTNGDGTIDYEEFLDLIRKSKDEAPSHILFFIKFAVLDIWAKVQEQQAEFDQKLEKALALITTSAAGAAATAASVVEPLPRRPSTVPSLVGSREPTPRKVPPRGRASQNGSTKADEGSGNGLRATAASAGGGGSAAARTPSSSSSRAERGISAKQDRTKKGEGTLDPKKTDVLQDGTKKVEKALEPKKVGPAGVSTKDVLASTKAMDLQASSGELVQLMRTIALQTEAQSGMLGNIDNMMGAFFRGEQAPRPVFRVVDEMPPEAPLSSTHGMRPVNIVL
jgi:hypothetical protein